MGSRRSRAARTIDLGALEAKVTAILERERVRQNAELIELSARQKTMQEVLRVTAPILRVLSNHLIPLSSARCAATWGEAGLLLTGSGPCVDEDVYGGDLYLGETGSLLEVDYFSPEPEDDPQLTWTAKVAVIPADEAATYLVEVGDDGAAVRALVRAVDKQLPAQPRPSRGAAPGDLRLVSDESDRVDE